MENEVKQEKPKKSIWKKWWFWLIIIFVIIILISASGGEPTTPPEGEPTTILPKSEEKNTLPISEDKSITAPKYEEKTQLSENSPEYQKMVYDHIKIVTEDSEINEIKVDGSLLYINFIKPQSKDEYLLVATMNAIKFSNFKKSKLGVSGVTVFCTFNEEIYAEADARDGKITETKSY